MTTEHVSTIPKWQVRSGWIPRIVEVELKGKDAADAAADLAKRGIRRRRGFVYTPIRPVKFFKRFQVWLYVVEVFRPGCESVWFHANRTKSGGITFTDTRDGKTGIAGTTGLWNNLPPIRPERRRSMTPNAFKVEVARFVGMERAEQIVQEIMQDEFFSTDQRQT